jgi:hypothetical protein
MKVTSSWQSACRCAVITSLAAGWSVIALAAPPPAPPPKEDDRNVFKKMGSFLFKKSRDFEKSQEPPKALPPPTSAQGKTKTGKKPQGQPPVPGVNPERRGETQYLREETPSAGASQGGGGGSASDSKARSDKNTGATEKSAGANELMGPPAPLIYAVPVAGRVGFVYPPGAERNEANMLDVRGLAPGQKARDPRTGNTFLVP